jgi:hypothetical protein
MLLYHYSNEENLTEIDPAKCFSNSHTPCDSSELRSYYYPDKVYREKFFLGSKYRYTVKTGSDKIYDLSTDFKGIYGFHTIDQIIQLLKKRGYVGLRFLHPSGHAIYCLFYSEKVIRTEVL